MAHPQAEAAAKWWADQLRNETPHQAGEPALSAMINKVTMMSTNPVEDNQAARFEAKLTELIQQSIDEREANGGWYPGYTQAVFLATDYHPDDRLAAAAHAGLIPHLRLPMKTLMRIEKDVVMVMPGHAAEWVTVWPVASDG